LQANHVDVVEVQKPRRFFIARNLVLVQRPSHTSGIVIAFLGVIDWHGNASYPTVFSGYGLAQVSGERGDATLARRVIADESNVLDDRIVELFHKTLASKHPSVW